MDLNFVNTKKRKFSTPPFKVYKKALNLYLTKIDDYDVISLKELFDLVDIFKYLFICKHKINDENDFYKYINDLYPTSVSDVEKKQLLKNACDSIDNDIIQHSDDRSAYGSTSQLTRLLNCKASEEIRKYKWLDILDNLTLQCVQRCHLPDDYQLGEDLVLIQENIEKTFDSIMKIRRNITKEYKKF
jgi:hypothetical protein